MSDVISKLKNVWFIVTVIVFLLGTAFTLGVKVTNINNELKHAHSKLHSLQSQITETNKNLKVIVRESIKNTARLEVLLQK